jgi:hypothetical protein
MAAAFSKGENPTMAFADRPLAYCTNVHPADSLDDLRLRLEAHALPVAAALGRPIAVGLWLPRSALDGLDAAETASFRDWLFGHGLSTTTMNAFPFGDFHSARVKERVYQPDWTEPSRSEYTNRVADFLAALLPHEGVGSLSTAPCAYRRLKPDAKAEDFFPELLNSVRHLSRLRASTGKTIRLALEPEPGCFLERTSEAIRFVTELRERSDVGDQTDAAAVREHLGVCFDICHSAVMFENPAEALRSIAAAGIPVPKIQLSSALELRTPQDRGARRFLAQFSEERYLHQTTGFADGRLLFDEDLSAPSALMPNDEWKRCPVWRIHFHVPIHKAEIGPLHTTTWAVDETLAATAAIVDVPDLEVETYTWDVLPAIGKAGADGLAQNLAAELRHAQAVVDRLRH